MGNAAKKELANQVAAQLKASNVEGLPREWFEEKSMVKKTAKLNEAPSQLVPNSPSDMSSLSWEALSQIVMECKKCRLCEGRNKVVFGAGKTESPLIVFVGEGPGAEEDRLGEPFVGKAGNLLTAAITKGMGLTRADVFICNVVKCRPPQNRIPLPDEVENCKPYLFRQLELLRPKVIVTLGGPASLLLTGESVGITKIRGRWFHWQGIKLMPTFHPAYLLRNPPAKKEFWEDLQEVMKEVGLPITKKEKVL